MRLLGTVPEFVDELRTRSFSLRRWRVSHRQVSAQNPAALVHIRDFRTGIRRAIERAIASGVIRNRDLEAGLEQRDHFLIQLLLLMGGVAAFEFAQTVAF